MTAIAILQRPLSIDDPAASQAQRTPAELVALRREAMRALDESVRTIVRRRLAAGPASWYQPLVEMTVYDAVYASTPAVGGHWTVAGRRASFFGFEVESYTIVLLFDEQQRPLRYRVCGATEVLSDDATPEALAGAFAQARRAGPQRGWAPAFMPGMSL
jgi:hypothetical protein